MGKNLMKSLERRKAKQEAHDEAKGIVLDWWAKFGRRHDVTMLYTLHKDEKYGPKKGTRFYLRMIENLIEMIEEFRSDEKDDSSHYQVMEDRLAKAGYDIDDLLDKADKIRMPERKYEERQRMIKELQEQYK